MPGGASVPPVLKRHDMDAKELYTRFTYHPPKDGQPEIYEQIRDMAHALGELILEYVPESREQSLSITALEEAIMWANAGVARRS